MSQEKRPLTHNAGGTLPSGEWTSFADMKDGLIRGTKYAHSSEQWFARFLKGKTREQLEEICLKLGGRKMERRGDLNMFLPFLPYFPVLFCYWEPDDEFDAAGRFLLDRTADHFLSIEDAVTVGEILQKQFEALT